MQGVLSAGGDRVLPIVAALANRARGVWPLEQLTLDAGTWVRCCGGSSVMGRVEGAMYAVATAPFFRKRGATGAGLDVLIEELNGALQATAVDEKLAVFDAAVLVAVYVASVLAPELSKDRFDRFLEGWIRLHLYADPLLALSQAEETVGCMRPPSAYAQTLMIRACLQQTYRALFEGRDVHMRVVAWPALALNCPRWLIDTLADKFIRGVDARPLVTMWRYYFNTCLRLPLLHNNEQLDVCEWLKHSPQALIDACTLDKGEESARAMIRGGFACLVRKMETWKDPLVRLKHKDLDEALVAFCAELLRIVADGVASAKFHFAPICQYVSLASSDCVRIFRALAPLSTITAPAKAKLDPKHLVVCHQTTVPYAFVRVYGFVMQCLDKKGKTYAYQGEWREHVHEQLLEGTPVVLVPCVAAMCVQLALSMQRKYDPRHLQNVVAWVIEDLAAYIIAAGGRRLLLTQDIPPIMQLELIRQQLCRIHDALFGDEEDLPTWYMGNRVAILACARWAPAWCYERMLQRHNLTKRAGAYAIELSPWELAGAMVDQLRLRFKEHADKQRWLKGWLEPNQALFVRAIKEIIAPASAGFFFTCAVPEEDDDGRLAFWRALGALLEECLPVEGGLKGLSPAEYNTQVLPFFKPMHEMYAEEFQRQQQQPSAAGKLTQDQAAAIVDAAMAEVQAAVLDPSQATKSHLTGQRHQAALREILTRTGNIADIVAYMKTNTNAMGWTMPQAAIFSSSIRKALHART